MYSNSTEQWTYIALTVSTKPVSAIKTMSTGVHKAPIAIAHTTVQTAFVHRAIEPTKDTSASDSAFFNFALKNEISLKQSLKDSLQANIR